MDPQSGWSWCVSEERTARQDQCYKNLLLDWIERAVDEAGRQAVSRLTQAEWPRARLVARQSLLRDFGMDPLPPRDTNILARSVGTLERDGYRIERLVLEPRPHFLMPVHLYVPTHVAYPAPAVLYSPGHWMINGKTEPDIQACCIGLAKLGFVVLVFDPIGQGERGAAFEDHARRDLLLLGLSQEGLMAWESMRAIDFLLTLPTVDGNRIGMTGASGGGLNTMYTCAADERVAAAVSVCYVTSFSRFFRAMRGLNWNNQNDLCNQVPNVVQDAEMAGLVGLFHPRPMMFINGTLDPQFPVDGARQVEAQVRDIYDAVDGARLNATAVVADHGYDRSMREAAYGWFLRWLQGLGDGSPYPEPPLSPEPPDSPDLKCFPGTSAIRSYPALRWLAAGTGDKLALRAPPPADPAAWQAWTGKLRGELAACLGMTLPSVPPCGTIAMQSDNFERHLLEPEPGMVNPAFVMRPAAGRPERAIVYCADEGKLGGSAGELLPDLVGRGCLVLAVDPRGLGEVAPLPPPVQTVATLDGKLIYRETTDSDTLEFEAATDALMLGRSLFGQQVTDLIHAVRYARQLAGDAPVTLVGSGPIAGLLALYAGALCEEVAAVVADRSLPSYELLMDEEQQIYPITAYVFGILRVADIPQVAAALAPRPLYLTRPIGACLQPLSTREAGAILAWTATAYGQRGAPAPRITDASSWLALVDWIAAGQP
jgi:dienelactone hydrolase